MDVGQKLKSARTASHYTQEQVAGQLGVSRQTISNWENNRSYPDIINVIALSSLYGISLDELLKEDEKMIKYLEESTDLVKSRHRFSKLILVVSYLLVWTLSIVLFWVGTAPTDAMGYSLVVFYFILPVATLVISIFIGKDDGWTNSKWVMLLFFGFMYMSASYTTFSLANMIEAGTIRFPEFTQMLPGILISGLGIFVGTIIRLVSKAS